MMMIMKDIKLKLTAISCILLILFMPVYSATVFAQDEEQTIEDKTPPSVNIEKPEEKVTEPFIDIKGTTNEPVVIEVSLNSNYYGTANSNEDNTISIGITLAEGENKIKINSTDAGGNSVINEFNVFCDSEQPQILYNNIYELNPAYTAEQTVKGQVNKADINIDIFVNEKKKYSGKSDSEGNFEIDINLDKSIKISTIDKTITVGTQEGNAWQNKIKIVATDDYGREATIEEVITYTLCGYGSDWDVGVGERTPDVIIPEHLIQGIAQFSFPVNLTYRGNADSSTVVLTSEPQLTNYDLSMSSQEKFQDELFPGSATSYWNDDYTQGYFIVNLNSWTKSKEELNNLSFIKIPLRLDIYYEYEDRNGDIVENTQRNCWDIKIMVDKEIPLDKIPKELLNATVNLLNSTINLIDAIKKPIDTIKTYTFVGCALSWGWHLIQSISVEFSCVGVKQEAIQALINGDDTCPNPPSKQDESGKLIEFDCDSCLQALKSLREAEKARNWLCDRIFCPAVPSLEYHTETYNDSITKANLCEMFDQDSKECEEEYKRAWDSAFMMIDEWKKANAKEGEGEESFFDKISEGLAFCEKAKEQEVDAVTIGSGSKQTVYLVYPDGSVCIGQITEIEAGTQEGSKVYVGKEGEKDIYYSCDGGKLNINEEKGVYTDVDGKEVKIPPDVQSKRGIEGNDNYILDPTSDIIRSVQAVCLPAVSGYLNLWKQILEAVKQCFETIMITGEGSAGVCKAVLTNYVCDMIYDIIRCTGESFSFGAGEEISGGITGLMQKISTAGTNVLSSVEGRYGQTGMYKTMFVDRKLIHSMCLFAFTGDWGEFDLDTLLTAEIGMPTLGSEGFLYPTTRRFMGSNPLDYGRTTYIYHIGAGLIAGADLNYKVYLQCSNDNSCPEGRCDCFYRGKEEIYNIPSGSGSLSAGDLYTDEFYIDIPDSLVRYDKAVIEWDWTDNTGQSQTTTKVSEIKDIGEKAPADCKLDSKSGEFRCKYIIGQDGEARLIDVEGEDKYNINDKTSFDVKLEIIPPESGYDIPKYLIWKIKDSKNIMVDSGQIRVLTKKGTIYEKNVAEFDISEYFTGKTEDKIEREQYNGNKMLEVDDKLIGTPYGSASFLVIFTDVNIEEKVYVYEIYSLTEGLEKDSMIYRSDEYSPNLRTIKYELKNIQFKLNKNPEEGDAAIINVEKGRDSHECDEDGEENWKVIFELLHSKKKDADLEGNNPQDYECCGSKIDSEEVEITIDCGVEQKDEENNCDKNELINEECKCGNEVETCGNVGADQWNICCEIESNVYCSKLIDESEVELDNTKISNEKTIIDPEYLNELCELS